MNTHAQHRWFDRGMGAGSPNIRRLVEEGVALVARYEDDTEARQRRRKERDEANHRTMVEAVVCNLTHTVLLPELNATFGTQQMRSLIGRAIAAKNPDLDAEISMKLGGWYYDRIRSVEAGQELTGQRAFSSVDVEAMRKRLVEGLGLSEEEVGKVLFQATARDEAGKAITSRQKMRTHMDENFAMPLTGRDGVTRNVSVHELWEDNMRSIVHAYNNQMAGAVSLAQLRIENPRHIPDRVVDGELIPGTPKYLVDGIHSDGDWDKLMAQARAVDDQVRYADGR